MEFERFPSLTRFSHGWTITEKLDGTNAQVAIIPQESKDPSPDRDWETFKFHLHSPS